MSLSGVLKKQIKASNQKTSARKNALKTEGLDFVPFQSPHATKAHSSKRLHLPLRARSKCSWGSEYVQAKVLSASKLRASTTMCQRLDAFYDSGTPLERYVPDLSHA